MKKRNYLIALFFALGLASCDKMLEFEPKNEILPQDALQTPDDLQSLLISCYDVMANAYYGNYQNLGELLSANLSEPRTNQDYREVYKRATIFFNGTVGGLYGEPYTATFRANTLLLTFDLIEGLTEEDRTRMEAEARFIRALSHFDVVNLFAQPYGYTTDNSHLGVTIRTEPSYNALGRSSVAEVYELILSDLDFAKNNLPEFNGVFANRMAAYALLARVYFQMNDFEKAAEAAQVVIDEGNYVLPGIDERWSEDISSENIFTLIIQEQDQRNAALINNYRSDNNDVPQLYASREYVEGLYGPSIPTSDARSNWVTTLGAGTADYYYNITKFNGLNYHNIPYLHYTEILLIHAESLAEQGIMLANAVADINMVRQRAGVSPLNENSDAEAIIEAARVEREKEFLGEGRIVFDLKRRGVLGEDIIIRDAPWDCNGMVLQFPISENTSNFVMNPTGGCN